MKVMLLKCRSIERRLEAIHRDFFPSRYQATPPPFVLSFAIFIYTLSHSQAELESLYMFAYNIFANPKKHCSRARVSREGVLCER